MRQASADQKGRLLVLTERLNQSGERINEGRRMMLESEELGVSILQDLHQQRQSLLHADNTVRIIILYYLSMDSCYHTTYIWNCLLFYSLNTSKWEERSWEGLMRNILLGCQTSKIEWFSTTFVNLSACFNQDQFLSVCSSMGSMTTLVRVERFWQPCQEGSTGTNGS